MARPEIDLLDGDFYVGDPYSTYAWMRAHEPVYWDATNELWGVSRYDDVVEIEKRKDLFISSDKSKGGFRPNIPADESIISLDDPLHQQRRNLVARRFTPRAVGNWEDHVRATVGALLDGALARGGPVEIVGELAAPLPAEMIGLLLGFPEEMFPKLQDWSERTIALGGGPRYMNEDGMIAAMEFAGASAELYEAKKGCPGDDVMSVWTTAEVPGHPFGLDEVISDCLLILDGGAETTRTVIARALLAMAEQPQLWEQLKDGADAAVAAEEFIRWVTPIHNMCRVAREDVMVNNAEVKAGQQLVLMYTSANRDEDHFERPEEIDLTRQPNNHLSFGFGTHFCLGSSLARLEIRVFLEELVRRVDRLVPRPGTVVEMPNAFVWGLSSAELEMVPA